MRYEYPPGLKISFVESLALDRDTRLAISTAADWLKENPDFEPKFEQLFNVVLAKDKATVAMTNEVFKRAGVDVDDFLPHMPLLGVDFTTYCIAVTQIYHIGWSGYITNLIKRNKPKQVSSEELVL